MVRDEYALRELSKIGISHEIFPCPTLFASMHEHMPSAIERIGIILQTTKTPNQSIPMELSYASVWAIKKLREMGFSVEVVCHYIYKFAEFAQSLAPVRSSYDARDYLDILNDYDLVISTRLYGAILANSIGKPAILLTEDSRCIGAARHFRFIYVPDPSGLMENIESIRTASFSEIRE